MDAKTPVPTLAQLLDYPVHPFAEWFPMLPDDDLADLAADIKANGLHQPIVVSRSGILIDGRNRREACHRIGHQPAVEFFEGDDAAIGAFIIGQNIHRRHLSKGQKAMAAAMILPDAAKLKRAGSGSLKSKDQEVSDTALSFARSVKRLAPELVPPVISGAMPLKDAYDEAKKREAAAKSVDARLEKLRALDPELAALVVDGTSGIEAAFAEIEDRQRKERIIRDEGRRAAENLTEIRTLVVSIKMAVEMGATGLLKPADVAVVAEAAKELQAMLVKEKSNVKT